MTAFVEKRREGAVLSLTLARPEKKNALTGAMYDALWAGLAEAGKDDDIGAILIAGKGGVFTAGNDLGDFLQLGASLDATPAGAFLQALAALEKPLVAAVDGHAVGIGTTLCFHCDLVYAAPNARFQMPFVNLALVPENASSLLAPLRFGMAKASEYLLLGEAFDAAEAYRLGLVNEVIDAAALHAHALGKALALAAKPRAAMLATRKLLRGDPTVVAARIAKENRAFSDAVRSPEARAFFQAFLQKAKAS
ncbi:MAG TPA: enoyl-CoA hydratase-related protein [Roseiarcus sp.]|nr:enoyl-CoA hydratase-related protein [Roseiarcus sp.]